MWQCNNLLHGGPGSYHTFSHRPPAERGRGVGPEGERQGEIAWGEIETDREREGGKEGGGRVRGNE